MVRIKFRSLLTKKRLKITVPLLIVLVIAVALLIVFKSMSGPAEGSVSKNVSAAQTASDAYANPGKYNGKSVSFSYPANYKIITSQANSAYLDILSLMSTDHSGKNITIEVVRESLQNDSGYNHRLTFPDIYKRISSGPDSVVFTSTNQNGSEQTGFISHNGLVASISLTADGTEDLSQDYNTIVNSLKWKQ